MADLGAIGTQAHSVDSVVFDCAYAQNITLNPVRCVGTPEASPISAYEEDWKSISGTVTDASSANAIRRFLVLRRSNGEFVASGVTTAAGAYSIKTPFDEELVRIVFDDAAGDLLNDLIDRVLPG